MGVKAHRTEKTVAAATDGIENIVGCMCVCERPVTKAGRCVMKKVRLLSIGTRRQYKDFAKSGHQSREV